MDSHSQLAIQQASRRAFFGQASTGLATAALATLLGKSANADNDPLRIGGLPELPHFAAKAKRVIYLFQNGGPPFRLEA